METAPTTITATEATCPACGWTTLHSWSVAAIGAAAAHSRGAHPELWQRHFYCPQDGFDHFAYAWQPPSGHRRPRGFQRPTRTVRYPTHRPQSPRHATIRPTGNASDHPHSEWYRYWDFITAAASSGHHLELAWDSGVAYAATGEDPMGTHLSFWPCTPRWVATWTLSDAEHRAEPADADPLLLPVADGPSVDAASSNVGEWMARVITTVAGRNPARPSHRDFRAAGYTSEPGQ